MTVLIRISQLTTQDLICFTNTALRQINSVLQCYLHVFQPCLIATTLQLNFRLTLKSFSHLPQLSKLTGSIELPIWGAKCNSCIKILHTGDTKSLDGCG